MAKLTIMRASLPAHSKARKCALFKGGQFEHRLKHHDESRPETTLARWRLRPALMITIAVFMLSAVTAKPSLSAESMHLDMFGIRLAAVSSRVFSCDTHGVLVLASPKWHPVTGNMPFAIHKHVGSMLDNRADILIFWIIFFTLLRPLSGIVILLNQKTNERLHRPQRLHLSCKHCISSGVHVGVNNLRCQL